MKKRNIFEPPRFMSTQQASQQLLEIIARRKQEGEGGSNGSEVFDETAECVAMARIGCDDQVCSLATHYGFFLFAFLGRVLEQLLTIVGSS